MRLRGVTATAVLAGLTLALWPVPAPRAEEAPLLLAMQDEMKRSMAELRMKGEPAPYFIEYEIDDVASTRAIARFGAVVDDVAAHERTLRVQVKVGDYAFDSSRFVTQDRGAGLVAVLGSMTTPLDDNYDAIRRQIWLTTDAAYKRAVSVFAKKKAAFQNRATTDTIPDFSRDKPAETLLPMLAPTLARRDWVDRAQQLSMIFKSSAGLDASEVLVSAARGTAYYLNSEGFKSVAPVGSAYVRLSVEAQAPDGMSVRDVYSASEARFEDLPSMAHLSVRATGLVDRVRELRVAPVGEEFTGAILVEGQASAELLRQALVPLLLARRPPDGENLRPGTNQATPFLARLGLRVLPDSFAVSDTPSLTRYEGQPVAGAYVVDDEAVPAQDVALVERGRLLTLLTSRTPQKSLPKSNGHGRSGSVQAGVFQMRSTQAVPASDLKARYLALLKAQDKPFGYIVRSIAAPGDIPGGTGPGGPVILDAVKVTLDGNEEPVRGLRFAGIPSAAFRDILDASEERMLYNIRLDPGALMSMIVPNLIFEELEVQRTRDILQKPPIVPSPPLP